MSSRYFNKKSKHWIKVDNKWIFKAAGLKCRRRGPEKERSFQSVGTHHNRKRGPVRGGAKVRGEEEGERGSKQEGKHSRGSRRTTDQQQKDRQIQVSSGWMKNCKVLKLWPDYLDVLVSSFSDYKWILLTKQRKQKQLCVCLGVSYAYSALNPTADEN